jgi:hypothetical protein
MGNQTKRKRSGGSTLRYLNSSVHGMVPVLRTGGETYLWMPPTRRKAPFLKNAFLKERPSDASACPFMLKRLGHAFPGTSTSNSGSGTFPILFVRFDRVMKRCQLAGSKDDDWLL